MLHGDAGWDPEHAGPDLRQVAGTAVATTTGGAARFILSEFLPPSSSKREKLRRSANISDTSAPGGRAVN